MAFRDPSPIMPHSPEGDANPDPQAAHSEAGDAASILSSRMTDIASEDGKDPVADPAAQQASQRRSTHTATGDSSRPNTGVTGTSSQRGASFQAMPSRRGYASPGSTQRGSVPASVSASALGRPQSSKSKTHVPSLTSNAFFRPMSSQRLQAQRGGSRPATVTQQGMSEDGSVEGGSSVAMQSIISTQTARQSTQDDGEGPPPPSRGTEMTELETAERATANTSPTQGDHPTGSLSESVRPLQRDPANTKGLSLNIDRSYKIGGLPTPSKSPRSFRSSFLLPARGDAVPTSPNRSTHGAEKLSSAASSPGLAPLAAPEEMKSQKLGSGSNYQYFTGNTVFFWGGRLQNTRHNPINIATGLFVVVPAVLFYVFSASWLWHNISPAIPIVFAYVFYICMSSFIHASVSDPGVSHL